MKDIQDKSKMKGRIIISDVNQINNFDDLRYSFIISTWGFNGVHRFELVTDSKIITLKAFTKDENTGWVSLLSSLVASRKFPKKSNRNQGVSNTENPQTESSLEKNTNKDAESQTQPTEFIEESIPIIKEQFALEIEKLTVQNQQLGLDAIRMEEYIATLLHDREGFIEQLETLTKRLDETLKENESLKKLNSELERKLNSEKEKIQILLGEERLIQELEERENIRINELERLLDCERVKTTNLTTELKSMMHNLHIEQKRNEILQAELSKLDQDIIESKVKHLENATTISQLQLEIKHNMENSEILKAKHEALINKSQVLEKELATQKERNKLLNRENTLIKDKISLYEKKISAEDQKTPQESELLGLTLKIVELESELRSEKNRTSDLSSEVSELNATISALEQNLQSKMGGYLEEKTALTFQILTANQKSAQSQLKLERLSQQINVARDCKTPIEDEKDINVTLECFVVTITALLKNLHLGYSYSNKSEKELLTDLQNISLECPLLGNFYDMYTFMKERLEELRQNHRVHMSEKETNIKALMKSIEDAEKQTNEALNENKRLIAENSQCNIQADETSRKTLKTVEEATTLYESSVKSLFSGASANGLTRESSVSFLSKLNKLAVEHNQLMPLMSSYHFLKDHIKKELLELRQYKMNSPPEALARTFKKLIASGLQAFSNHFIQVTDQQMNAAEREEKIQILQDVLARVGCLEVLKELTPVLQKKIEVLLEPREERYEKYEKEISSLQNKNRKLNDEVITLQETLVKLTQVYQESQENLKACKYSISVFQSWMAKIEESCRMLGSILQDYFNDPVSSPISQNTLSAFELRTAEKEERIVKISKDIPEIRDLVYIIGFVKEKLNIPSDARRPRVSTGSPSRKMPSQEKLSRVLQESPVSHRNGFSILKLNLEPSQNSDKHLFKWDLSQKNQPSSLTDFSTAVRLGTNFKIGTQEKIQSPIKHESSGDSANLHHHQTNDTATGLSQSDVGTETQDSPYSVRRGKKSLSTSKNKSFEASNYFVNVRTTLLLYFFA